MKTKFLKSLFIFICVILSGCMKPYNQPEFKEVAPNQTAFVIPLELEMDRQVKIDSKAALEDMKVAAKRIPVTKRFHQTGRFGWQGEWIPNILVILVDRTTVNRLWTADSNSGSSQANQALWLESKDSVGFSVPFNCSAYIPESSASTFLYFYPNGTLSQILDDEGRNKVYEVATEVCSKDIMDILRSKKDVINQMVSDVVVKYFSQRGIQITTVGIAGEFTYDNSEVQKSIDAVFIAQQEKNTQSAKLSAMRDRKERMKREGIALGNQYRETARGIADKYIAEGSGEFGEINAIVNALEEAKDLPLYLMFRELEVEQMRIKKWGGFVPSTVSGDLTDAFVPSNVVIDDKSVIRKIDEGLKEN